MNYMTNCKDRDSSAKIFLFLLLAMSVFALLFFRVSIGGDNPSVLADEYSYAAESQALWLHQAPSNLTPVTGNWLYLAVNSVDFAFKSNFMTLARVWNIFSLALCCGVFFSTFRKFAGDALAGGVILVVAATFGGTYSRLFMPEAMQFAAITIATCAFYQMAERPSLRNASFLGVALGLGILTKVHAILLTPCFLVGICLVAYTRRLSLRTSGSMCISFLAASLLTVYALRLAITGRHDLNLLGNFYGGIAENSGATWAKLPRYAYVLKRHFVTLFLMFSPSIAIAVIALIGLRREISPLTALRCTIFSLALGLGGMLLVSAVFTVSVAGSGPYESLNRIHGRYYEHLLMLIAVLGALGATKFQRDVNRFTRLGVFFAISVMLVLSYTASSNIGWQNPTDFVAAFGLYWVPQARTVAMILSLVVLMTLALRPTLSNAAIIFALFIAVSFSAYECDKVTTSTPIQGPDRAAAMVGAGDVNVRSDKVIVITPQLNADLYRTAFHLLRHNLSIQVVPSIGNTSYKCPVGLASANWVITLSTKSSLICKDLMQVSRFNDTVVYSKVDAR